MTLKRVLLTLLITGATLLLVGTVLAVVLIKPEKIKNQVLTQLSAKTGYTIRAGEASLALGWRGAGIKVRDIAANSPDSSVIINMDGMAAYVKLLPLLQKRVALEHLSLEKPSYVLRRGPPSPQAARKPGGNAVSLATIGVDSWSISDGMFRQYEPGRGEFSLSGLDLAGGFGWDPQEGIEGKVKGTIGQGVFFAGGRPWPFEKLKTNAAITLNNASTALGVERLEFEIAGLKGQLTGAFAKQEKAWVGDLEGSVDQASWEAFQSFLTPVAQALGKFDVAGRVALPELHVWRTVNGQNNIEGEVALEDISVKMEGAPAGLSNFEGTARFTPETLSMKDGKGQIAGQPLRLTLDMTGTSPRKVRAHVVTALPGDVAGKLIPKDKPITLAGGSLNVDVVLERAFPGQGLPAWAGQVGFKGLSGTLGGVPFSGGSGRVAMNGRSADVQSLAMQIGRSDFNVHGTIPDVTQPWFNFSLVSNVLDVDELTAKNEAQGRASATSDSKPRRSPFGIAGDGPVRVGTLHFKQQAYQDVRANARLDQSGITLGDLSGRIHGGTVTGNLRVSPRDGRWAYEGNLVGTNMEAGSVLATWVPKANVLVGRMNGAVDLSGLAGKGTDAKKTLTMIGQAKIDGGGLRNISGLRALEKYLNAPELTAETWPIRDLATQFEIRDGAAVFKGLHLEQEGLEWNLAGQIGFDGGLNLQGELRALPERLKLPPEAANISQYLVSSDGRIEVNFNVRGKSSSPNVSLDWEDLIEDAAGRLAQAEATGIIQRQLERAIGGRRSPADSAARAQTDSIRKSLPIPVPSDTSKPLDMFDKLKDLLGGKKAAPDSTKKALPDTGKGG